MYILPMQLRTVKCQASVGKHYACGGVAYKWDDVGRLSCEPVCQLLVVGDQVVNVDVAVILLQKRILFQLVSVSRLMWVLRGSREIRNAPVNVVVVQSEAEDELFKLLLQLNARVGGVVECGIICARRVH